MFSIYKRIVLLLCMYRNAPLLHYVPVTVFALLSGLFSPFFVLNLNDFRLAQNLIESSKIERILTSSHYIKMDAMQLDLRDRQKRAVVRMFDLFVEEQESSFGNNQQNEAGDIQYKILILDKFAFDVIAPLLRVNELRQHGITLTLLLESEREQIPDVPAVYFVQPTAKNIQKISQDLGKKLYESYHLHFTRELPRSGLEELATASVKAGISSRVKRVFDQNLDFVSLEKDVFSIMRPDAFKKLNDPKSRGDDIEKCIADVTNGLFATVMTMGQVPIIRCPKGGAAEMVGRELESKLRDYLGSKNGSGFGQMPLIGLGNANSAASQQMARPILAIFDRNYDFTASLQHAWHYEPLVHDVLHMKLNRVDVKPDKNAVGADAKTKSYALDDSDDFWRKYKDAQFPKVAESVEVELAEYKRAIAEVNAASASATNSAGDDADDQTGASTAKLTKAVESLPKLQEHKKLIDKHTNIATALLKEIKHRGLDEYFSIEEDFCNGKGDWKAALSLLGATGRGSASDKIRLALIMLLTSQLNSSGNMGKIDDEAIEGALRASGCECGAYNYVKKMLSLNQQLQQNKGGNTNSNRSQADILDWADRLYGQSVDLITKTAKHLLSGERQLPLAAAVEALLANQPSSSDAVGDNAVETFAYFDAKASASQRASAPPASQSQQDEGTGGYSSAVAFVLGGGCYAEVLALRELAQRERTNGRAKSVCYGATDMCGGDDFVTELGQIGGSGASAAGAK